MKQSFRALRILLCAVILVFCFIVESSLGIRITVFGAHFDFLPPIIAASAVCLGCPAGLVCGFLAGMLYDAAGAGIEGLYPIYYMFCGILCGLMSETRKRQTNRLLMTVFFGVGMPVLMSIIRYLFYFQFVAESGLSMVLQKLVAQAMLAAILCLPVYWVISHISDCRLRHRWNRNDRREQMNESNR
jgi:rod shape-determining protein MreD